MTTQRYEVVPEDADIGDIIFFCQNVTRTREDDIDNFNNLKNIFMGGRKVGKFPTGSSDIEATDRIGDFNYDADYLYICVDDSGAAWRRVILGSW